MTTPPAVGAMAVPAANSLTVVPEPLSPLATNKLPLASQSSAWVTPHRRRLRWVWSLPQGTR